MNTIEFSWPEGKAGAVTSSWDDGLVSDRRLIELFNRFGIKGTWNLNSGLLGEKMAATGWKDYLDPGEIQTLFAGHEVAVHTLTHPRPWLTTEDSLRMQMWDDRRRLEDLMQCPITGYCHPFGCGNARERLTEIARGLGFCYARSSGEKSQEFAPPDNFMNWPITCHFVDQAIDLWNRFVSQNRPGKLFYFWGHSWEMDDRNEWGLMDEICRHIGEAKNMWHATNGQIYDYIHAWRSLRQTLDGSRVENRSGQTVWITVKQRVIALPPGRVTTVPLP